MPACGNAISTIGCKLFVDKVTPGTADLEVKGHTSISFSGVSATEIDATSLCDTDKQYMNGLKDLGTCTVNINTDYTNAGQNELRAASGGDTVKTFSMELANGDEIAWTGIVRTSTLSAGIDSKLEGSFEIRLRTRAIVTPVAGTAGNA